MDHNYSVFDRASFDPVWRLSWAEFIKKHRSRWALSPDYCSPDGYNNDSLRGLIGFAMASQTSPEEVEDILKRRTIRWTLQNSDVRLWMLSELIEEVRSLRGRSIGFSVKCDLHSLVAAAVEAYLAGYSSVRTLRAVSKLHCADPIDYLKLTRRESAVVRAAVAVIVQEPIYAWLGPYWLADVVSSNGLNVAETRAFFTFVHRAWKENWPYPRIKDMTREPFSDRSRFRDFALHKVLAGPARRITGWQRPMVFREWC